ncbi:RNase A-like domain-containing protein, partial [Pseudomonas gessardii]|uniref:RNase A-like domain-containing protein n=1 Tax=Pseudomonas gessardii TaxID=78544 RepID=UPI001A1E5D45|nr:type IV secretion protein Rhs [Pseudomonas gessardii]
RHRYYNPDNGRYLTPDPVKLAGGLNGYLYVPNPTGWVDPLGLSCKTAACPGSIVADGPYSEIVPGGGLAAHEAAGGHLIKKHIGRTNEQLASRLKHEPYVPTASTFHDRATAESTVSKVIADNGARIDNFTKGSKEKITIIQKTQHPIGTSLVRGALATTPGTKIYLVLLKDKKMPTGYKILTGYPSP